MTYFYRGVAQLGYSILPLVIAPVRANQFNAFTGQTFTQWVAVIAPVRSIQRMPSNTLRLSARGLPPRLDLLGFGNKGSIFFHCSSVNIHLVLAIKNPFDDQVYISLCVAQA